MKTHEELINKVRTLISENETEKALELLSKHQLSTLDKELILLSSRYSKLAEEQRLGIIDESAAQIRTNKINLDILNLSELIGKEPPAPVEEEPTTPVEEAKEVEKKPTKTISVSKTISKTTSKPASEKTNSNKIMLIVGALLLLAVAGIAGTMFFKQKAKKDAEIKQAQIEAAKKEKAAEEQTALEAEQAKKDAARLAKIILGEKFEGGIIFHIDETGKHGLIMAQGDVGEKAIKWLDRPVVKAGAYDTGVYDGITNTEQLVNKFGDGIYPAKLCADYVFKGYEDWYLPSQDELDLMWEFTKGERSGEHKGFTHDYYWSSTEISGKDVYYRSFYSKGQFYDLGNNKGKVRAIRKF